MTNNSIAKFLIPLFFILSIRAYSTAQIVEWTFNPTYKSIERYSSEVYKVIDINNKSWLQFKNGQKVYDPATLNAFSLTYDSIAPVIDGLALLLEFDQIKNAWRLAGIFDAEQNTIKNFGDKEKYYIDRYGFFSERLLPVKKDNKKYGYITPEGNVAIKFNFGAALPFSQGKAVVSKETLKDELSGPATNILKSGNQKQSYFFYIDYFGDEITLPLAAGKKFVLCSTFLNGEATVINNQGQSFVINDQLQPTVNIDILSIQLDDVGVNLNASKGERTIGLPQETKVMSDSINILQRNNLIGYEKNGHILISPQFSYGGVMDNGYAIVSCKDGMGLIHILPDSLSIGLTKSNQKNENDSIENLKLCYNIPESYIDTISITDIEGKDIPFSRLSPTELDFTTKTANNIRFCVTGNYGLVMVDTVLKTPAFLFLEQKKLLESMKKDFSIDISPLYITSNTKNQASVKVNVTNNTSESKTVTISISGSGLKGGNYKVRLAAGKSKTYYPLFTKIVRKEKRAITVIAGDTEITRTIQVNPKSVSL